MSEKMLPIRDPILKTFPQQTNMMAILSMYEDFYPWFYSNFIQLKCSNRPYALDLLIYPDNIQRVMPLVEYQCLTRRTLGQWFPDVIGFIIRCIDDDLYFHATVNSYYISLYEYHYQKYHRFHEILIIGYDLDAKILYGADFFHNGQYACKPIPFADFEAAYVSVDEQNNGRFDIAHSASTDLNNHLSQIELMRFNPRSHWHTKVPYRLDIGNIVDLLGDYLHSSNTSRKYTVFENAADENYGLSVYDWLIKHAESILSGSTPYCDVRSFHILYEHKKCMVLRMKYLLGLKLEQFPELPMDSLIHVEANALTIRNQAIKYSFSKDKKIIAKLISDLQEMALVEKKL
ncbi:hypothetical protein [Paenibacillus hexagrammi]|uniref:Uncharacterized protein n=1 Tax=Paenibacillus hexagrammi TaxID=2908839 RepID=A0ABY3SCZ6_9BACL|nr:hypothetical protein [Paenibacillus sp. YPD9-1]UJF31864.1 hypothetical protein L0M14_19160 [Paenibacillus sp. YPD9-1]